MLTFDPKYTYFGAFSNRSFLDVFPDADTFLAQFKQFSSDISLYYTLSDSEVKFLYLVIYGRYGSEYIASSNVSRFKTSIFNIVLLEGPIYIKRLDVQKRLMDLLDDDEILAGGKAIFNKALNPGNLPSTADLEEINYINEQNTTNYIKSPTEGYALLLSLLQSDYTERFLRNFRKLFLKILAPNYARLYDVEELNENIENSQNTGGSTDE